MKCSVCLHPTNSADWERAGPARLDLELGAYRGRREHGRSVPKPDIAQRLRPVMLIGQITLLSNLDEEPR